MAASHNLHQHRPHGYLAPIVPCHGVVTLFGFSIKAYVDSGHLVLEDGIGPARRQTRFPRVGHRLRRLVIIGADGFVSLSALRWLADQDAGLLMLDRVGKILVATGPVRSADSRLRRAQGLAHETGIAIKIARELIIQKLHGQEQVVRKFFKDCPSASVIADARRAVFKAKTNEEIRRWEAKGALAYWGTMREVPANFSKADSAKIPEHWKRFGSRVSPLTNSPRLAINPANSILNYCPGIRISIGSCCARTRRGTWRSTFRSSEPRLPGGRPDGSSPAEGR